MKLCRNLGAHYIDTVVEPWAGFYFDESKAVSQRSNYALRETLLEEKVDEESAGLVGMALTSYMMDRSRRRQFDMLLKQLRAGKVFEEAVTMSFAPPKSIVKSFLGK